MDNQEVMKAVSLQLMTKDIEGHCYILSLDNNLLDYCIFQRLDLFYWNNFINNPRECINTTFVTEDVLITGLNRHYEKESKEERNQDRNYNEIHWTNT